MSRISTQQYIARMRERYICELTKTGKTRIISKVCETTGFSRKYVIKLLSGYIEYREHKGRGKTYGEKTTETLKKSWLEAGCPCAPYLKARACGSMTTRRTWR